MPAAGAEVDAPGVAVRGLVKRYGSTTAVDGLDLDAARGAVTAVLGPNGAGKTTAVEVCEGLRSADGGEVRVLGLDPARDGSRLRPRVGVVLQDGGLPTQARALELLRHVARLHDRPRDVGELVERLGLGGSLRTPVRRLSGGQRQRLALAVAVVGRPEVAFLDEPTAGLDPQARHAVWDLVADLRADGVAVVLTTHAMEEAERLADHVVVVDAGRSVASGSVAELVGPGGDVLRFAAPPRLDLGALRHALGDRVAVEEVRAGEYVVRGQDPDAVDPLAVAAVTAWCASEGLHPSRLELHRRSLEDVVLDLTGRGLR